MSYALNSQKTQEREYRGLTAAAAELGVKKLTVITMEEERTHQLHDLTIDIQPAYRWFCGA